MNFSELDAHLTRIKDEPAELENFITGLPHECMSLADAEGHTVVHMAAMQYGMAAFDIMVRHWGAECLTLKASDGFTPVHLAAMCMDERAMQTVTSAFERTQTSHTHQKYSAAQLFHQSCNATDSVFHLAAMNHMTSSVLKWLVEDQGPECLTLKDNQGNTPVHLSALCQSEDLMSFVKSKVGAKIFYLENRKKETVFHSAARNVETNSTLKWLVEDQGAECLTLKDDEGNTPVHLSALYQTENLMSFVKSKVGAKVFYMENWKKWTVFHSAARNMETNSALKWLVEDQGAECLTLKDDKGNTPMHLSALYQTADSMSFIKSKVGAELFSSKGFHSRTAFHLAALNLKSNSALKWLVSKTNRGKEANCLSLKDDANASVIHYAALHQDEELLSVIVNQLGTDSLSLPGHLNKPSICYAACNKKTASTVDFILKKLGPDCLLQTDDNKRNFFHFCAFNTRFGVQLFEMAVQALKSQSEAEVLNDYVDAWGRTPLHYACLMKNFAFIRKFLPLIDDKNGTDADGNTLLHSLFQTLPEYSYVRYRAAELASCAFDLVESGVQLNAENLEKHTCLMAAEVDDFHLKCTIDTMIQKSSQKCVKQLLTNSDGLHAIHVYSGRHRLRALMPCLVNASGESEDHLLHLSVPLGPRKGAKCLHFACEAGHKENIEFLIGRKLQLWDETQDGQSCLDFACNRGTWKVSMEVALKSGLSLKPLLCLIDPPHRALKLPSRSKAHSIIHSYADAKFSPSDHSDGISKGAIAEKSEDKSPSVLVLFRAVELDSTNILRSLLALRISVEESSKYVVIVLAKRGKETDCETLEYFPDADTFVEKFANKNVGIQELALYFDKVNILSDLAVLGQFDLIPVCIRLLILVKGKVKKKVGKHEQLCDLQESLFSVLINAMNSLYHNADESNKNLLFRYLAAEFDDGPKFELRRWQLEDECEDDKWYSVIELLGILNSDKVFVTDALSSFVDKKWSERAALPWETAERIRKKRHSEISSKRDSESKKREQKEANCCSSALSCFTYTWKFYLYSASYAVFLITFFFFVTDFRTSLTSPLHDVIMYCYAMSFTMQEVNDFVHTRESVLVYIGTSSFRVARYFANISNWLDLTALTLMWVGLIWKWVLQTGSDDAIYGCQMVLATSFLLCGFRALSLLSFFKVMGSKISMLKTLVLKDFGSVLGLLLVVFFSFSAFYFSLLLRAVPYARTQTDAANSGRSRWQDLSRIWTLLVRLTFGLYEPGDLQPCNASLVHSSGHDCVNPIGLKIFNNVFVFVFLLLVVTVIWNVVITSFSFTVALKENRSEVIWRRNVFSLWKELSAMSFLPPPFSILEYSALAVWCLSQFVWRRLKATEPEQKVEWWKSDNLDDVSSDFKAFLKFQAFQLRQARPKLHLRIEKHVDPAEAAKAFTGNAIANSLHHVASEMAEAAT